MIGNPFIDNKYVCNYLFDWQRIEEEKISIECCYDKLRDEWHDAVIRCEAERKEEEEEPESRRPDLDSTTCFNF